MSEKNPDGSERLPLPIAADNERVTLRVGFDSVCRLCRHGFMVIIRERECPIAETLRVQTMLDGQAVPGGLKELASPILMKMIGYCQHPSMLPPGWKAAGLEHTVLECAIGQPREKTGISVAGLGVG